MGAVGRRASGTDAVASVGDAAARRRTAWLAAGVIVTFAVALLEKRARPPVSYPEEQITVG